MKDDKLVTIYVETKPFDWPKNSEISHEQVVKLAVPDYVPDSGITYSVMFERGHGEKPKGTLAVGTSMKVKDGISFTVSDTGQS